MDSRLTTLAIAVALSAGCADNHDGFSPEHTLWYDEPASAWEETLPLGNGRLGMMPDGGIDTETIVLNEISMWSGSEADYANPDAAESLPEIRRLLLEGRNGDAQEVMYDRFLPHKPADGGTYGGYQTLGDLVITRLGDADVSGYRRWLDLSTATAFTSYGEECRYRKYYVSRDYDVMIIEIDDPQGYEVRMTREQNCTQEVTADGLMKISGTLDSGTDAPGTGYAAYAQIITEGKAAGISADGVSLSVRDALRSWIIISAATSFFEGEGYDAKARAILDRAVKDFDAERIWNSSVKAHKELYDRAVLHLEQSPHTSYLPTDERLYAYAEGSEDNALAALYYNYGRYLLIASTRPGSLPPNLQGLWADTYQTPWNGDYHTNINVQMNHWIAGQGNLCELELPLTDLVLKMIPSGEKTAKDFYGKDARGWVQHMMTNVWNFTAPGEHPSWGATNTGGAWLCDHLWEHYRYTGDKDYLAAAYPALKGASEFFLSTMIREPEMGYLVTAPSSSPENSFYENGKAVSICIGPTMDTQIIRELFRNTIEAGTVIDSTGNKAFNDSLKEALALLPPHRISKDGYLMEWMEDYEETDIHHRHISHLYGLHPGSQISPDLTPDLAEACKVTLNRRGDEATGWSRAWKMNFWARLQDGERALRLFRSLLYPACENGEPSMHVSGTYPNLFCSHPPFQIDGNFGGAAGIGEMLLQSHLGYLHILPALPADWSEGSFSGFKTNGGAVAGLVWSNRKPVKMQVKGGWEEKVRIKIPEGMKASVKGCSHCHSDEFVELLLRQDEEAEIIFYED